MGIGPQEIILVFIIIILLFGANKIPELARSLGKATGEFKKGKHDIEAELSDIGKPVKAVKSQENTSSKIKMMAQNLGIATEGKSDDQLLEEIQKKSKK